MANELSLIYKCITRIIPYVMTWEGVVTSYHKKYIRDLGISENIEAYIQPIKKTLESLTFEQRRGIREDVDEEIGKVLEKRKALTVQSNLIQC